MYTARTPIDVGHVGCRVDMARGGGLFRLFPPRAHFHSRRHDASASAALTDHANSTTDA